MKYLRTSGIALINWVCYNPSIFILNQQGLCKVEDMLGDAMQRRSIILYKS
jgi:hypothetical protein